MRRIRFIIFLRDVLLLALTSFGGPQAHISFFFEKLVKKRGYLTEEELVELNALCNILPGPTSTQTITAIGFKIGGPKLAFLTLLVWIFPAVTIMTTAGIIMSNLHEKNLSIAFTRFIQPMAVGFVAFAAFRITKKVVKTRMAVIIMIISSIVSYFFNSPYLFPFILISGGAITSVNFNNQPIEKKDKIVINWSNFILWGGVFIFAALLGHFTRALPIRLFENFYRNGSLIFGGGQVLIPLLYTEFVEFKRYLFHQEFLSGYAMVQSVPGPTFSFAAYVGALSMRQHGVFGEILGGLFSAAGIFLPGTFFIFFVIRFWNNLKKYRIIKASLEGINATSSGMVIAAAFLLLRPLDPDIINYSIILITFCLLAFTKVPAPFIIVAGLITGFIIK